MSKNYLIFNRADKEDWADSYVGRINEPNLGISLISNAYVSDDWSSGITPFDFPTEVSSGTANMWILKWDFVDHTSTGFTQMQNIYNWLTHDDNIPYYSFYSRDYYLSEIGHSASSLTTAGASATPSWTLTNAEVELASINYDAITNASSGQGYSSGFAGLMSGNEEYPTDYWSKTDFQVNRNTFKDDVISKISTNQNDIIEFLVKNSLTPEAIKRLHVQLSNDSIIT